MSKTPRLPELTPRERPARGVAEGLSNAQIATSKTPRLPERLRLSLHTVKNMVYGSYQRGIYDKIGAAPVNTESSTNRVEAARWWLEHREAA